MPTNAILKKSMLVVVFVFYGGYALSQENHMPIPMQLQPLPREPIRFPWEGRMSTRPSDTIRFPFPDTVSYHLNLTVTGIINNTNSSNSFLTNNSFSGSVTWENLSLSSVNTWVYGKQGAGLTNNDFSSTLDLDLFKGIHRLYYWGLGSYTTSLSLGIHGLVQTGAGLAYAIVDKKEDWLAVSDGLLYEKGDLFDSLYNSSAGNIYRHDVYEIPRNSFRLLYHWTIGKIVILEGTGFFQNALTDRKDYVIKADQRLSVKLGKWLSFTTSMLYNKFTRTGGENALFTIGLTFDKRL